VPVSAGELFDKITILRLKATRIADASKRTAVTRELELLEREAGSAYRSDTTLAGLVDALHAVNEELWEIEDAIRVCEQAGEFGPEFVALARAVYRTNDRRSAAKAAIDAHLGSTIVEVKSYAGD
jgi:hypothetical protein